MKEKDLKSCPFCGAPAILNDRGLALCPRPLCAGHHPSLPERWNTRCAFSAPEPCDDCRDRYPVEELEELPEGRFCPACLAEQEALG